MENKYLINQISRITGITLRTLRYYDNVGLLKPKRSFDNKYRVYSDDDIDKLYQILLYKELGVGLDSIDKIISSSKFNTNEALEKHSIELSLKITRLTQIKDLVDKQIEYIKEGKTMNNNEKFKTLSIREINLHEKKYKSEVKERFGSDDAYLQCAKKYKKYSAKEKIAIFQRGTHIFQEIADNMNLDPSSPKIKMLIEKWQQHITNSFYDCTDEILQALGEGYASDNRFKENIDKIKVGLADYLSKSIKIYIQSKNANK